MANARRRSLFWYFKKNRRSLLGGRGRSLPLFEMLYAWHQGRTWFSCSLYSFHSEQAEQKSSALEHLCWRTPEYSVFRGGVDRTVTWPVPKKKMADHCLHAWIYFLSLDLFRSTPSVQFYLFRWMFWRTPSTLKIAKSSPPQYNERPRALALLNSAQVHVAHECQQQNCFANSYLCSLTYYYWVHSWVNKRSRRFLC